MLTLGLSCHPCGMLSRGSAASLLIQLSPVLFVWSSVATHSFPFEQGYDEELLVPSKVAKLFLMPFREILIFYGAQSYFLCVSMWILLELSAAWQPTSIVGCSCIAWHCCCTQRHLVVSPSFSWKGSKGLLQPLFTWKIVFNGAYQAVVGHHSSLPSGSKKHSLPEAVRQFQQPQTQALLK